MRRKGVPRPLQVGLVALLLRVGRLGRTGATSVALAAPSSSVVGLAETVPGFPLEAQLLLHVHLALVEVGVTSICEAMT